MPTFKETSMHDNSRVGARSALGAGLLALLGLSITHLNCRGDDAVDEGPMAVSALKRELAPQISREELAAQVKSNSAFALDLYHQLRPRYAGKNLFASPHSISTALAMTYGGARGNTETQMAKALRFVLPQSSLHPAFNKLDLELVSRGQGAQGSDGRAFELSVANSLWGRPDGRYLPPYLDLMAVNYGAGIRLVDFGGDPDGARKRINDWVAGKTHDRIKDLLQPGDIDRNVALVLVNAIYFNAAWLEPFEVNATGDRSFDADGSSVSVKMMSGNKRKARYGLGSGHVSLELPFDGDELSMVLIVPDPGTWKSFQQALTPSVLDAALGQLAPQEVELQMPRFSFTTREKLRPALEALGMVDAFDPNAANFEGICGVPGGNAGLVVSDVVHQAFVQVAEKGAEAAASTAVVMKDGGVAAMPSRVKLTIDRPFLFLIRDKATGMVLFLGHVIDPNV
jgi:serpin B